MMAGIATSRQCSVPNSNAQPGRQHLEGTACCTMRAGTVLGDAGAAGLPAHLLFVARLTCGSTSPVMTRRRRSGLLASFRLN